MSYMTFTWVNHKIPRGLKFLMILIFLRICFNNFCYLSSDLTLLEYNYLVQETTSSRANTSTYLFNYLVQETPLSRANTSIYVYNYLVQETTLSRANTSTYLYNYLVLETPLSRAKLTFNLFFFNSLCAIY